MDEVRDQWPIIERVYRDHRVRLWRALLGYCGDRDIADDALAETFAQALTLGDRIERPDAWVWRTAFRVAAGELKRRGRTAGATEGATLDAGYDLPEPIDHLLQALSRISPNQRLAVLLHDYADRPTAEIAQTLGTSRATVHVHLSQGRRRLRRLLEDDR